ncbi:hypothetical protein [Haloarchaeobius sp. HRN-SO-5]|uniref:hypothetical protein n=1 Tax=Haloarchaeobius sp. HRN-SO-5 TaxID=3446118 RepID=UPI003EBFBD67
MAVVATAGVAVAVAGSVSAQPYADDSDYDTDDPDYSSDDDDDDRRGGPSDNGPSNANNAQGPPVDMPDQVPHHVVEIHYEIRDFLDGYFSGTLGDAISELTPDDGAASVNAAGASA